MAVLSRRDGKQSEILVVFNKRISRVARREGAETANISTTSPPNKPNSSEVVSGSQLRRSGALLYGKLGGFVCVVDYKFGVLQLS